MTANYTSKNADWNQQLTDGGILANWNSENHPYCFLSNKKNDQSEKFQFDLERTDTFQRVLINSLVIRGSTNYNLQFYFIFFTRFWRFCMWSVKELYHALLLKTDYGDGRGRGHDRRLHCPTLYFANSLLVASAFGRSISPHLSKRPLLPRVTSCLHMHHMGYFCQSYSHVFWEWLPLLKIPCEGLWITQLVLFHLLKFYVLNSGELCCWEMNYNDCIYVQKNEWKGNKGLSCVKFPDKTWV